MAHPQNSPRGSFIKASSIGIDDQTVSGNTTGVTIEDGLALGDQTDFITQGASGVKFPTGLALSGQSVYFTANSTATMIIPTVSAKPAVRIVGGLVFVSNSTGKMLAYHSTGTTWAYLNKTSVLA